MVQQPLYLSWFIQVISALLSAFELSDTYFRKSCKQIPVTAEIYSASYSVMSLVHVRVRYHSCDRALYLNLRCHRSLSALFLRIDMDKN